MRIRPLLLITALVSSLLAAVVVYLVLTVPNDIQAASLLRHAKQEIAAGQNDQARRDLSRIIQEYPRTDAAAAATVALATIADQERHDLMKSIASQKQQIADLSSKVASLAAAPPPAPVPQATPAPAKKTHHRAHRRTRHRRRHR